MDVIKKTMKPAIVLSSHTMGLGVIRSLGRMGVPVVVFYYDTYDMGYVSKYVTKRIRVPHPEQDEQQFLDFVLAHKDQFAGSPIFPTSDAAIVSLSLHKHILEPYYRVACTEWPITQQFIQKQHTYALASRINVAIPKTVIPYSLEDIERAGDEIGFPCLVKPCQSHRFYSVFRQKMFQVHNLEHLRQIYQQATRHGLEVMLQEIIPGEDSLGANYNAYWWDGRPLVEFTAQKIRNAPPKWGSPRVVVSRFIPQILEAGRSILQEMNFYGYSCTEFKRDPRDGIYKLMEVNGRHNLSTLLAVKCGINFPWLHYRHLVYNELPCATEYQIGTFWIDLIRDVGYSIKCFRQENISLAEYVRPYWHPHVFAVFDPGDLKPFIKRCVDVLKPQANRNGSVIEREKAGGP